ncbi:TonB-dependent receptor domain-containing protein [Sphingomonas dokdonensis]|uniref:Colicin I receptor n=1 Tax=Sphingomonas dokdonensis TaxID=344880 RepID=A0A245ZTR5_9SPHN|nr:TonB-dependent receptor [Sphingomonas dokdonensis]OWK33133.1 colicin I receptor precursor [Sphingomonas dokdonensis]
MRLRSCLLTSGALLTILSPLPALAQVGDLAVPPAGTVPAPAPSVTPPQSTAVQPPLDDRVAQDIIVTGSLIRGQKEDAALPVDVITAGELQRQGSPSVVELLKALPVANGTLGDSNQFDNRSQGAEGIASINLRGLGPSRTLVLLNSRRLVRAGNGVPTVDVNLLPLAAIGRIDILKDGAAATYGSDAIAGVVNFITNRSLKGLVVSGDYKGIRGSGGDWTASAAFGHNEGALRVLASFGYQHRSELMVTDRDFAIGPYTSSPENGFTQSGNPGVFLPVFGNGQAAGGLRLDAGCVPLGGVALASNGVPNQRCGNQYLGFNALTDTEDRLQAYLEVGVDLTPDVELEVTALYGWSQVPHQRSSPSFTILQRPSPYTLPAAFGATAQPGFFVPTSNPGYAAYAAANPGSLPTSVSRIPVAGATFPALLFRPFLLGGANGVDSSGWRESESMRFTGALTGALSDALNFDVSGMFHQYTRQTSNLDTIVDRVQLALRGFGGPDCNRISGAAGTNGCQFLNPFSNAIERNVVTGVANPGYNASVANSSALSQWLYERSRTTTRTRLFVGEASISGRTPLTLPGGDVAFAVGGQYRRETYNSMQGAFNNLEINPCRDTPITGNVTCSPQSGPLAYLGSSRPLAVNGDVYALFAELRAPILNTLDLQLAARYEDYGGGVGSTFNPKATLRWQTTDWLALRGSVGTTFRGPPDTLLQDGYVTSLQVIGNSSRAVRVYNNPNLRPEKATNYSAGAIVKLGGVSLSVDYFRYELTDLIVADPVSGITNAFFGASGSANCNNPAFAALRARFAFDGACAINNVARLDTFYLNGAKVTNSGLDILANYDQEDVLGGRLGLGVTATYVIDYKISDQVVEGVLVQPTFDAVGKLNYQTSAYPIPRWRGQAYAQFGVDGIDGRFTFNYVDSYVDQRTAPFAPRVELPGAPVIARGKKIGAWSTVDFTLRAEPIEGTTISLSVLNITDRDPSFARLDLNYDPFTGNALGRQWKIGVTKKF